MRPVKAADLAQAVSAACVEYAHMRHYAVKLSMSPSRHATLCAQAIDENIRRPPPHCRSPPSSAFRPPPLSEADAAAEPTPTPPMLTPSSYCYLSMSRTLALIQAVAQQYRAAVARADAEEKRKATVISSERHARGARERRRRR